ncbi:MAG: TetR/AcrR family transcriptional regulator [Spiribacter salinus]|uniref:TetR/AcrR family transcriptional regulator n=1 Tax=Spiribacter salinus TaxID=1335746 RepID=A0A540VVU9_9GAMM|nr:MAG: TetR/AcrR family transcriptional regulator [Spiribacter salinus]
MARTQAKDHGAKRGSILDAAARVFAQQGFDRASMSALAEEAGISKANIYHYYSGKDALLFDLLDSHLRDLRDRLTGLDLAAQTPQEKLKRIATELLLAYQGADNAHRVQSAGMTHLPDAQVQTLKDYQREMVRLVASVIRENAPDTFNDDPEKLRAATMSFFGMLNWHYMWAGGAGDGERRIYAAHVAALMIGGLSEL